MPNKVRRVDSGRTGEVQELLDYSRRRWKKIKTKFWAVVGKPETMAIVGTTSRLCGCFVIRC